MTDARRGMRTGELGDRDVHVWYRVTDSCDAAALAVAMSTLSADERARADRFRFERDRRDYIVAHDLLRRSLSRYASLGPEDWEFDVQPGGRPVLRGQASCEAANDALTFSLSHTRGLVACAVAREAAIGVDVERTDRSIAIDELGRSVLSASELATLMSRPEAARTVHLIELWTLKEAYAKATGQGVSAPLSTVTFDVGDRESIGFTPPEGPERTWLFALFAPAPEFRMAVSIRGTRDERWQTIARLAENPDRPLAALRASWKLS